MSQTSSVSNFSFAPTNKQDRFKHTLLIILNISTLALFLPALILRWGQNGVRHLSGMMAEFPYSYLIPSALALHATAILVANLLPFPHCKIMFARALTSAAYCITTVLTVATACPATYTGHGIVSLIHSLLGACAFVLTYFQHRTSFHHAVLALVSFLGLAIVGLLVIPQLMQIANLDNGEVGRKYLLLPLLEVISILTSSLVFILLSSICLFILWKENQIIKLSRMIYARQRYDRTIETVDISSPIPVTPAYPVTMDMGTPIPDS